MDLDRFKRLMWLRTLYLKWVLPLRYPLIMNIEPTNRCNLACTMCPRSISRRPLVDLDWGLFEILVEELRREGPILKIFLQKDGEPLIHPRIAEMVRRLHEANAARNLGIITNGTLLSGELFADLANAGLHDLIISIDAVNPPDYLALKGVDKYDQVVGNVERAISIKKGKGWRFPQIKARLVARKGRENEVAAFRLKWIGKADFVDITPFHTWLGAVPDQRCYGKESRYPCALLWYTGVVNSDGRVSPCCIDYNLAGDLGKIGAAAFTAPPSTAAPDSAGLTTAHPSTAWKHSRRVSAKAEPGGFARIWNGKAFRNLRRLHVQGDYHQTAICEKCEYWLIKEDIGRWLRRQYCIPEPTAPPTGA